MKIVLKQDLRTPHGIYKAGDEINIVCDENNLPIDSFWRNRVKDSVIDNCLEVVKETNKLKNNK
jgi:hypothetical protein